MSVKKQNSSVAAGSPTPAPNVPAINLIAGYPASGKSSLVKVRFPDHFHINRDKVGGKVKDLLPVVREQVKKGQGVVTDNLFATRESRKDFVELANELGVPCNMVVLDTDIEDAQVNVVVRLINYFGHFPTDAEIKAAKHPNVFPPAVLYKYRKEYQDPKMDEGFGQIERVPFRRNPWPGKGKALLLDFDGTLRDCPSGNKFPTAVTDIKVRDGAAAVLKQFKAAGYLLLGVSNQSGVAKGELTHERAVECFDATNKKLGVEIDTLFCPHRIPPVSCYCRKPGVGMPVAHVMKHSLDPALCVLVGDMTTDKTCAGRVGMQYQHADEFFAGGYKKFL